MRIRAKRMFERPTDSIPPRASTIRLSPFRCTFPCSISPVSNLIKNQYIYCIVRAGLLTSTPANVNTAPMD
jgi:hypothetical protein